MKACDSITERQVGDIWLVADTGAAGAGRLDATRLAAIEVRARSSGCEQVWVDCVAHDTGLVRFYQRQGYYPSGIHTGSGGEVRRLRKDLDAALELERMFENWQPELTGTLLFVIKADQVLLIDKKTGHGAGKVNAPGGKLEEGESPAECAIRETWEEVGIQVEQPQLMARLKFADTLASQWFGYVFVAYQHRGHAIETREANPHWVALDAIPYDRMWSDDRIWLPLVLAGQQVDGQFLFDDGRLRAHRVA